MNYQEFLIGPQLIGVLFIIIGGLQRYLPPKKINRWYGYRTQNARIDQQTWDEGNRYSAIYMIKLGLIVFVVGFIINALAILYVTDFDKQQVIRYVILFGGAIGIGIISTMATEKHLALKFKTKIKKRK